MKTKLFTAVFGVLAFGFAGYGVYNYMAASPVAVAGIDNKTPEESAKRDALAKIPESEAKDDALAKSPESEAKDDALAKSPEADAKDDALAKDPEAQAKDDALGSDNLNR